MFKYKLVSELKKGRVYTVVLCIVDTTASEYVYASDGKPLVGMLQSLSSMNNTDINTQAILKYNVSERELSTLMIGSSSIVKLHAYDDIKRIAVFELATFGTLQSFLFETGDSFTIKNTFELSVLTKYLEEIVVFFTTVVNFLLKNKIVYCDWKFENIMVFYADTSAIQLKLADFGSVQVEGERLKNVSNINAYFTSPNLCKTFVEICPRVFDDCKSICYLFCILNKIELPWHHMCTHTSNVKINVILATITNMKYQTKEYFIDTSKAIVWPNFELYATVWFRNTPIRHLTVDDIFSCLNLPLI